MLFQLIPFHVFVILQENLIRFRGINDETYPFGTVIGLLLAIVLPLVMYQELSWLHFINMMFYIVGGLFIFSLLSFVIQKGFFDVTFI